MWAVAAVPMWAVADKARGRLPSIEESDPMVINAGSTVDVGAEDGEDACARDWLISVFRAKAAASDALLAGALPFAVVKREFMVVISISVLNESIKQGAILWAKVEKELFLRIRRPSTAIWVRYECEQS